jgi:hypothetical protein
VSDIERINQLIISMGEKFRAEMARPIGPMPTQFPVRQSFTLAATQLFLTLPAAIRALPRRMTPEDLARRNKRLGAAVSPLGLWMLGYHFLVGREILLDLGELEENAQADDIILVLDFWRRLCTAHRGDGHLHNSEGGFTNLFLPGATVERLYHDLIPIDSAIRRQLKYCCAALDDYLFLLDAEGYLSVADSGPYPLNIERLLVVREYNMRSTRYPWQAAAIDLPYQTCVLAFTLDPADFRAIELSDRALLLTTPSQYLDAVREVVLGSADDGVPHVLPLTEMSRLAQATAKAQPALREWFTRRSRRDWIISGAWPWVVRPLTAILPEGPPSVAFVPLALELLPLYEDDDARALRWATHRCLTSTSRHAFTPLA